MTTSEDAPSPRARAVFRSRCWIVLGFAIIAACQGRTRPPNMVIVLVDTLRADRLGVAGNRDGLTPFLDRLASRATVFRNAYAASSWTIPSVASLFTSRYPSQHRTIAHEFNLVASEVTLAEQLGAAGYHTLGASANVGVTIERGFAQGFDRWSVPNSEKDKMRGQSLNRQALRRVDEACPVGSASPCLLYMQYIEPHAPYEPPLARRAALRVPADNASIKAVNASLKESAGKLTAEDVRLLSALYDQEVAAVDEEIGALFAALAAQHFLDDAVVVITADHGEEFKEHGGVSHGTALYGETIRVPLIVLAPGCAGGRVVEDNVSLLDVAPTLIELAGAPPVSAFEGRSLVPLLGCRTSWWARLLHAGRAAPAVVNGDAGATKAAEVIFELPPAATRFDRRRHVMGIVRDSAKLLVRPDGKTDLYDLSADPGETAANAPALEARRSELDAALHQALATYRARAAPEAERVQLDETTKERLRALGYDDF